MNITDVVVNPDNIHEYDIPTEPVDLGCATVSAWILNRGELDKCLAAHMTLNTFLEEQTDLDDAGGEYANWLNSMGFEHQTDNGWWNEIAVNPANIFFFIALTNNIGGAYSNYKLKIEDIIKRYNKNKFNHDMTLVVDFVNMFS